MKQFHIKWSKLISGIFPYFISFFELFFLEIIWNSSIKEEKNENKKSDSINSDSGYDSWSPGWLRK